MKKQSGFTLIELAIVLVIIGLLLGGVLKGQELIFSAKIKNVVSDFSGTTVGYYAYQDRYKAIPGDDKNAVSRWGTTNPAIVAVGTKQGNSIVEGLFDSTAATDESAAFWLHMRQAGFVGGSGTGGPANAFAGVLGVQNGGDALQQAGGAGTGLTGVIICESNVPDKAAIALDNQLDDGSPNTGVVRALLQADANTPGVVTGVAATTTYAETGANYYTMCKSL